MLMSVVSGCATNIPVSDCTWVKPIYPTPRDVDVISDELVEKLLIHNDSYVEFCRDKK